jgi:hypothetical protein
MNRVGLAAPRGCIANQASYLACIDVFAALALSAMLLLPLAFRLQRVDLRSAPASVAH